MEVNAHKDFAKDCFELPEIFDRKMLISKVNGP
jgi:hypothetical protein